MYLYGRFRCHKRGCGAEVVGGCSTNGINLDSFSFPHLSAAYKKMQRCRRNLLREFASSWRKTPGKLRDGEITATSTLRIAPAVKRTRARPYSIYLCFYLISYSRRLRVCISLRYGSELILIQQWVYLLGTDKRSHQ